MLMINADRWKASAVAVLMCFVFLGGTLVMLDSISPAPTAVVILESHRLA